jgi:pilus assembly protein Flp/PilA
MRTQIQKLFKRLQSCEQGATLVEYGIALAVAAAVGVGGFTALGGKVSTNVTAASSAFDEAPS